MMKLQTKYILFVVVLHALVLLLSFFIFEENKILFIASEAIVLFSAFLSARLYQQLIRPINLLVSGAEAMKDRDFTTRLLPAGNPEMDQIIGIYNQMMDELRKERTRQEQQHLFLEKLIQTSPTGIIILDYDDYIHQVNPTAMQFLGIVNELSTPSSIQVINHPLLDRVKALKSGESAVFTLNGTSTFKIQKSHFIDRGFPRHFIMIEELTAELLAAEKNAYGKVIRMMAHEVNNSIGPVNSILDSALSVREIWNEPKYKDLQNALQVAIERNQNLNSFMRNFADLVRLPAPAKTQIDINPLIRGVLQFMELKAGEKKIFFQLDLPDQPFLIAADRLQMEQVLINIIKNAIEAIGADGNIAISVDAKGKTLLVTDNGSGISEEQAALLFSPFYSTKPDGQGIGLTLIREVLSAHEFSFSLKTLQPGQTVFRIDF